MQSPPKDSSIVLLLRRYFQLSQRCRERERQSSLGGKEFHTPLDDVNALEQVFPSKPESSRDSRIAVSPVPR